MSLSIRDGSPSVFKMRFLVLEFILTKQTPLHAIFLLLDIASLSIGIAKGAFVASVKYSQERHQFGKPISSFQAISFELAEMATKIEASELLTRKA
ncbi:MAG: hypothetical protein KC478_04850, partial [Bacteriovoracaceae bacterium]|nr:hypothetical protein [Bacteriovoracaceae bacterium]